MTPLQLGPWQPLEAVGGTTLAIDGPTVVAASAIDLVVWRDGREIAAHRSARRLSGRVRLAGDRVLWGDGMLALADGGWTPAPGVDALFAPRTPHGEEIATVWAWSADGAALAVGIEAPGATGVRFMLLASATGQATPLWRSTDVAPRAAWVGAERIVLGSRQPQVWSRAGELLGVLDCGAGVLPAFRIETSADERLLLLATPGTVMLWSLPERELLAAWPNDWIDAVLTPDGRKVFALDAAGRLHGAAIAGDAVMRPVVQAPAGISTLACDHSQLLVAAGDRQRWHKAGHEVAP
jgi:hypothetical protein